MKATKLPSGSWRVRVFSHYEYKDGKKVPKYESFTSKDKSRNGKREAEYKASEWLHTRRRRKANISLSDVVNAYIRSKMGVLSPSSVRAYRSYAKNHLYSIADMPVEDINIGRLQLWVSELSGELSPKSVKEIVALVSCAYKAHTGKVLSLTLPQPSPAELHTPTDKELKILLDSARGTELELAISLAAFCALRRGEVCALTAKDYKDGMLMVSKTVVRDVDGLWIIKEPKTPGSVRVVPVPEGISALFPKKGKFMSCTPDALTKHFIRAVKKAELPPFRFHDLRHYYASIAHYLGVPDAYVMANGGWSTDSVMKRVYREALADKRKEENDKITRHYDTLYATKP